MHSPTSVRRAALGAALVGAAFAAVPARSSAALPQTCLSDGVCFTKTFSGASTKLTVTGTAGDDNIVLAHVRPFSNNTPSGSVSVNGKDAHVNEGAGLTLVVNALGGKDSVTEQFPTTTQPLYGTSTIDGGAGNDTIAAAFRNDVLIGGPGADVLDGGAGNDQLVSRDGERDVLHGGLGTDAAQSDPTSVDTIDGVEMVDARSGVVGRVHLAPRAVRAKVGKATRLSVSWTHPRSWRELKMMNLQAFDGATQLGNVYVRMRDRHIAGHGVLQLVSSTLERHGRTAKARLAVRLPRSLAGQDLRLAVQAADVHGHRQAVPDAGELRIAR
jgi:RTX calcium-binding nonapeptide repeat (4 copies)